VDRGKTAKAPPPDFRFRGGCTLLVDLDTSQVRYCIVKNILSKNRLARQRAFHTGDTDTSLRAMYFGDMLRSGLKEPFAFLHRSSHEEGLA